MDPLAQGYQFLQQGRFHEAALNLRRAVERAPDHSSANHLLGLAEAELGNFVEAKRLLIQSLKKNPPVDFIENYCVFLVKGREFEEALAFTEAALRNFPARFPLRYARVTCLSNVGRLDEALAEIDSLLSSQPENPMLLNEKGAILASLFRHDEAIKILAASLKNEPGAAVTHFNLARTLQALERTDEAIESYDRALALQPDYFDAALNRAIAIHSRRDALGALAAFQRAAYLRPYNSVSQLGVANALCEMERYEEALSILDKLVEVTPEALDAHVARSVTLVFLSRPVEALAGADAALVLNPFSAEAHHARALALKSMGRFAEATASLGAAIEMEPNYAEARLARAFIGLLLGDYEKGWADYEWRFRTRDWKDKGLIERRSLAVTAIGPGQLQGKLVQILDEQGLGDTIMFSSIVHDLAAISTVSMSVDPRLMQLLQRSFPQIAIRARDEDIACVTHEPVEIVLNIGSLGHAFRNSVADFSGKPFLKADPVKVSVWKSKMPASGRRIGVSWRGGTIKTGTELRSIGLDAMKGLLTRHDDVLVSLQHDCTEDEIASIRRELGSRFVCFPTSTIYNLDDLASLMSALDVIVSVQNTNVHLAGALGIRCFAILPPVPEWRYGLSGEQIVWYETVTLVRRAADHDVASTIRVIAERL